MRRLVLPAAFVVGIPIAVGIGLWLNWRSDPHSGVALREPADRSTLAPRAAAIEPAREPRQPSTSGMPLNSGETLEIAFASLDSGVKSIMSNSI